MSRSLALLLLACALAPAQTVTELKLSVDPETRKIRPGESATIHVQIFGKLTDGREGRIRRDGFAARASGGTLTKAFKFQGSDNVAYLETTASGFGRLLGQGLGQYTVKDAVLFTAPSEPGKYSLSFSLESAKVETTIEVAADAPSRAIEEKRSFGPEPASEDPYRKLAQHWAPFVAQETWFQPRADYLARFDSDGDWRGDNNWDNLDNGSTQAYVYYAAMETGTHVFLVYDFFHPRDYSDNCALGSCHENDSEGIILAIQKDGSEFGRLQTLETLAHNNVYSYVNDASLKPGIHDIEASVVFWQGSHPMVFLEAGGHGALSASDRRSLFSPTAMAFAGAGVTYIPKGVAERPSSPVAREVGYELLSAEEHWWRKASSAEWKEPTFDELFDYVPFGGRPRPRSGKLYGAFLGRKQAVNKARPFWGWFDTRGRDMKAIAPGQWAADPAYSLSRSLTFPKEQRFSLDYTYNPYLDIATDSARASMQAPEGFVAAVAVPTGGITAPVAATAAAGAGSSALRGALGQVLSGSSRDTVASVLKRAGVGSGGMDALRSLGGVEAGCVLSVIAARAADIIVRNGKIEPSEGVEVKGECTVPQGTTTLRTILRSGPAELKTLQPAAEGNGWATHLRLDAPGRYELSLTW